MGLKYQRILHSKDVLMSGSFNVMNKMNCWSPVPWCCQVCGAFSVLLAFLVVLDTVNHLSTPQSLLGFLVFLMVFLATHQNSFKVYLPLSRCKVISRHS